MATTFEEYRKAWQEFCAAEPPELAIHPGGGVKVEVDKKGETVCIYSPLRDEAISVGPEAAKLIRDALNQLFPPTPPPA